MAADQHTVAISPIGAFELKQCYQKNMFLGLISVALFCAFMVGTIALIKHLTKSDFADAPSLIITDLSQLGPPPSLVKKAVQVKVSQAIAPPSFNLPEAVPDEEVVEDFVIVSQEELAEISSPILDGDDLGGGIVVDIPLEDYMPRADEFVAVEEQPQRLDKTQPVYPEMAQKAGIEGTVWVKVLVDKDGNPRDALILKESGANAGFEENALEAAMKTKWRPAIQNKQPVAVWISYKVHFTLRNSQ